MGLLPTTKKEVDWPQVGRGGFYDGSCGGNTRLFIISPPTTNLAP